MIIEQIIELSQGTYMAKGQPLSLAVSSPLKLCLIVAPMYPLDYPVLLHKKVMFRHWEHSKHLYIHGIPHHTWHCKYPHHFSTACDDRKNDCGFFSRVHLVSWNHFCSCVGMCVRVCPPLRALITSGMIWRNIVRVWLVKQVLQLFRILLSINWKGFALVTWCVVHARQRCQSWRHTSHRRRCINYLAVVTRGVLQL